MGKRHAHTQYSHCVQFVQQKSVPIAPLLHVRTQSDRPFGLSVTRNKVTARNVRKTLIACPHKRFTSQHATPGLRHKTQHKSHLPFRSSLAWITDKEFTGSSQSFSLSLFPLYCLTHMVTMCPCSPISRPLGLLHFLPCHIRRQAARIDADHKPRSYKRSTFAHSHKLHIDTVCLCCNVLCPCYGVTFSFMLPLPCTTQLFFRCHVALRQARQTWDRAIWSIC